MKKYIIKLSRKERGLVQDITSKGNHNARVIKRATVLLKSHAGETDTRIAMSCLVTSRTVQRVRLRYTQGGLKRALYDAPRPGQIPKLDAKAEAKLVAIACSPAPQGYDHWTLELLQKKLLKDKVVSSISTVAVWYHLKRRDIKPWREKNVGYPQAHARIR